MKSANKTILLAFAVAISATAGAESFVVSDSQQAVINHGRKAVAANVATRDDGMLDYEYGDPIYDLPEGGTYKLYNRSNKMFYYNFGELTLGSDRDFAGEVMTYENGDVYLRNMIPSMTDGSWLKGKLEGNKIVMSFPQVLCKEAPHWEEDEWVTDGFWPVFVMDATIDYEEGEIEAYINETTQEYVLNINEDGSITSADPDLMIGVFTRGGLWYEESAWNFTYLPFDDEVTTAPAGLDYQDWAFSYRENAYLVKLAYDGNDIYLKGFYTAMPEAVIKGYIDGNTVKFPSRQFMGVDETNWHLAYFIGTYEDGRYYKISDAYEFDYNAEMHLMIGKEVYMMVNAGKDRVYYISAYYEPVLKLQTADFQPANPRNPSFEWVSSFDKDPGTGEYNWFIVVMIPNTDVNGNILDTNRMWYNFYFDDELFVFDTEDYGLVQDSPDVPYNYDDGWNIYAKGYQHQVYFYFDGVEKKAIQSIYEAEDGTLYKSDIVVWGEEDVVSEINAEDIVSVEWYDLQGRKVTDSAKGIFIKKTNLKDGSSRSSKQLKF